MSGPQKASQATRTIHIDAAVRAAHASQAATHSRSSLKKLLNGEASYNEALLATGLAAVKPPLVPGTEGEAFYNLQPFQILSWYPRAVLFPWFTDQRTRQRFIDLASTHMDKSTVSMRRGQKTQNIRTSSGAFVASPEDETGLLADVENRIAKQCMLPVSYGEAFNVLRYDLGQKYDSHMDIYRERSPRYRVRRSPHTRKYTKLANALAEQAQQAQQAPHIQRAATTLLYLTTPEEGGHTIFKREGRDAPPVTDYLSCDKGFKYKPRAGDALMFWSLYPNHTIDEHALHGGCPVTKGQKWAATKWVHDLSKEEGVIPWLVPPPTKERRKKKKVVKVHTAPYA